MPSIPVLPTFEVHLIGMLLFVWLSITLINLHAELHYRRWLKAPLTTEQIATDALLFHIRMIVKQPTGLLVGFGLQFTIVSLQLRHSFGRAWPLPFRYYLAQTQVAADQPISYRWQLPPAPNPIEPKSQPRYLKTVQINRHVVMVYRQLYYGIRM